LLYFYYFISIYLYLTQSTSCYAYYEDFNEMHVFFQVDIASASAFCTFENPQVRRSAFYRRPACACMTTTTGRHWRPTMLTRVSPVYRLIVAAASSACHLYRTPPVDPLLIYSFQFKSAFLY